MQDSARSVGAAPEGIVLGVLLGAGSYGRVYRGEYGAAGCWWCRRGLEARQGDGRRGGSVGMCVLAVGGWGGEGVLIVMGVGGRWELGACCRSWHTCESFPGMLYATVGLPESKLLQWQPVAAIQKPSWRGST